MKIIITIFLMLLVPVSVSAQEAAMVDYSKCEYDLIHNNIYAPFYFHIQHDPAISQTFKQRHDDNPAVVPFQRAPEGVEPGQATWFEFGAIANATATYEFELGLEYKDKLETPRPIIIHLFSQGNLMMEKKIYQDETIGCVAFKVHAVPPPHQFTADEILSIAKLEFVGITKQYGDKIDANTEETKGLKVQLIATTLVLAAVIGFILLNDRQRKKSLDTLKDEYLIHNDMFATSIMKSDANLLNQKLNLSEIKLDNSKMIQTVVNNFGHMMESLEKSGDMMSENTKRFIDDLRSELELQSSVPLDVKPDVTFADLEKISVSELVPEKPLEIVESVPDMELNKIFPFDIDFIKTAIKKPLEIFKKERPIEKPELDKLKEEWLKLPNEELSKLFIEYNTKAGQDLHTIGHGENYKKSLILLDIMNSRTTDYKEDKS